MAEGIRLRMAIDQIRFARGYTLGLIEELDDGQWFQRSPGGVTHIAWQVGHLAMAEYALTMIRIRGKEPTDQEFISNHFFRTFKKGTKPSENGSDYPEPAEIRRVAAAVHERALEELAGYTENELDVKLPEPHAVFDTKLGSVIFCSSHEMLHAGQIGLMRRQLGMEPLR